MIRDDETPRATQARFGPTRWTLVLQAQAGSDQALEELCAAYWYPAYAFVRRSGHAPAAAQDLVQSFFAERVLSGAFLAAIHPAQGTFRAWFCQSLRHFLLSRVEHASARKRGGGLPHLELDDDRWHDAEERYRLAGLDHATPDRLFDRAFGVTLVGRVLSGLAREYDALGKRRVFEALEPLLSSRGAHGSHAELAVSLGLTEGALRVALSRLRHRFGQALLDEVLHTAGDLAEARAELAILLQAWAEAGSPLSPPPPT